MKGLIHMAKVRTRKRGTTYSYIFEAGKTAEGKRKVVEKGGFPTEQEAYEAGVEAFISFQHGDIGITSSKILLSDYLDKWLDTVSGELEGSTVTSYQKAINSILKHINNTALQELTPKDIDSMARSMAAAGLASKTIRTYKTTLSTALNYAIYPCELIHHNPAQAIKVPKSAPTSVKKRTIITTEILDQLLDKYALPSHYYIFFMLAYYTGMRRGEILGLEWQNVDLDKRILHVRYQQKEIAPSVLSIGKLKNDGSKRDIFFGDTLYGALLSWKEIQDSNKAKYGNGYVQPYTIPYNEKNNKLEQASISIVQQLPDATARDFVCTQSNGKFIQHQSVDKLLHKLGLTAHSFRHTHATILIENGATPKEAAARLGHSSTSITEDIYTHVTEGMKTRAAIIFENAIKKRQSPHLKWLSMQTNHQCRQFADKFFYKSRSYGIY